MNSESTLTGLFPDQLDRERAAGVTYPLDSLRSLPFDRVAYLYGRELVTDKVAQDYAALWNSNRHRFTDATVNVNFNALQLLDRKD